jgi:hypothetical protein
VQVPLARKNPGKAAVQTDPEVQVAQPTPHLSQTPTALQNSPVAHGRADEQALFKYNPLQVLPSQVKSSRAALAPDPQETSPRVQLDPIGIAIAK